MRHGLAGGRNVASCCLCNGNAGSDACLCYCDSLQVPEPRWVADPPLLRVENEGAHAYLSMLLHLNGAGVAPLLEAAQVESRLIQLCTANLEVFNVGTSLAWPASRACAQPLQAVASNVQEAFCGLPG